MEGLLVQVDCLNPGARLWLQVAGRKEAFEIPPSYSITLLRGGEDVVSDLQCGPQPKPQKATIRYSEEADPKGTRRIVRVLELP